MQDTSGSLTGENRGVAQLVESEAAKGRDAHQMFPSARQRTWIRRCTRARRRRKRKRGRHRKGRRDGRWPTASHTVSATRATRTRTSGGAHCGHSGCRWHWSGGVQRENNGTSARGTRSARHGNVGGVRDVGERVERDLIRHPISINNRSGVSGLGQREAQRKGV